jgi:arginyl-tRNA synthetase
MNIENYLKKQLKQAVQSIGLKEEKPLSIDLSPGKQKEHGDFATNLPFLLAPLMRQSPKQIGQSIIDHIELEKSIIEKVEMAGAGFINFTLSRPFLQSAVRKVEKNTGGVHQRQSDGPLDDRPRKTGGYRRHHCPSSQSDRPRCDP